MALHSISHHVSHYSYCINYPLGVPLVPDKPQLSELRPEGAVLLEWNSVATNRTGPVLYIVWVRWNVGKHHSDAHMMHWKQIKQVRCNGDILHLASCQLIKRRYISTYIAILFRTL